MLKASSEGPIVLTIALGLALTIVWPQSTRRRLNSYNFDAGLDYGKTTGSKRQEPALWYALLLWDSCALIFSRLICCFLTAPQIKASAYSSIVEQKFCGLFEQKKNHKAVSMVITLTQGLTLTILRAQSTWERAQLSRQKISASPPQIYNAQAACLGLNRSLRKSATIVDLLGRQPGSNHFSQKIYFSIYPAKEQCSTKNRRNKTNALSAAALNRQEFYQPCGGTAAALEAERMAPSRLFRSCLRRQRLARTSITAAPSGCTRFLSARRVFRCIRFPLFSS